MSSVIRHRGPDDEGYVFFPDLPNKLPIILGGNDTPEGVIHSTLPYCPKNKNSLEPYEEITVAFGHRRLSIVDLSPAGHQPMSYKNGRYWITYNGEIYNWKELRTELELLGHRFMSHTDTEVILAAYSQWGKECLHHMSGMWAFVIFDTRTNIMFAARDRFGIKPLYYWYSPEGFLAFASEIKQFTVLPGWAPKLNEACAYDFLVKAITDHTAETLFQGVFQVRGGCAAEFGTRDIPPTLPVYQWYTLKPASFKGDLDKAADIFRNLFSDSIRRELWAEVPVGSCLSGGLDSSSIVCIANDILKSEKKADVQKTFSACSDVSRFDEREYSDEVIRGRQIEAHYTCPSLCDLFTDLDMLIWHQDEPFGSTSIYAQWLVFLLAAENHVTVMLDGQGADEQLCGYHTFFLYRFDELFAKGRWITLVREILAVKRQFGYPLAPYVKGIAFSCLPEFMRLPLLRIFINEKSRPSWISITGPKDLEELSLSRFRKSQEVTTQSCVQLLHTSLPMLLHWEDRNSMAHSIESRVPFLDHNLVEMVLGLPSDYKIVGDCTKRVLRIGMSGILPEKIRSRKDKLGFVTAEEEWIRVQNTELFRREVKRAIATSQGIISEQALIEFDAVVSGKQQFSFVIWRWICFGRWMERFAITR